MIGQLFPAIEKAVRLAQNMQRFTLYIDESGTSNLNDKRDNSITLTGLILKEDIDHSLTTYFELTKKKHSISTARNFHSVDFYEIKNSPAYVSDQKAKDFSRSVSEILTTIPNSIFSYSIDKDLLRKTLKMPSDYDFKFASNEHKADKEIAYEILARYFLISLNFSKIMMVWEALSQNQDAKRTLSFLKHFSNVKHQNISTEKLALKHTPKTLTIE